MTAEGVELADVDDAGDWFLEQGLGRVRIRATPRQGDLFPGIAPRARAPARSDWDARDGRWAVVAMNPDGTRAVAADVTVGARFAANRLESHIRRLHGASTGTAYGRLAPAG